MMTNCLATIVLCHQTFLPETIFISRIVNGMVYSSFVWHNQKRQHLLFVSLILQSTTVQDSNIIIGGKRAHYIGATCYHLLSVKHAFCYMYLHISQLLLDFQIAQHRQLFDPLKMALNTAFILILKHLLNSITSTLSHILQHITVKVVPPISFLSVSEIPIFRIVICHCILF